MAILDSFIQKAQENIREGYYRTEGDFSSKKWSLKEKLEEQEFSLIAEIKHASPTGEYLFENIDIERAARLFRENGADAISVVAEPKIFKGRLLNVAIAKNAGLPVLFKDFVICEEQVKAAKRFGADAILLIVKVAQRLELDIDLLIESAHRNQLEVLLETYNEKEMRVAMETDADILGINNRNLQTLSVDIRCSEKLLSTFDGIDRPIISESGIRTRLDAELMRNAGADGVLVGTALWKAKDIGEKIRELKLR